MSTGSIAAPPPLPPIARPPTKTPGPVRDGDADDVRASAGAVSPPGAGVLVNKTA